MTATVRYTLIGNFLTKARDFRARVLSTRTATIDDVVEHIVQQGSTVTRSDILSVLEGYYRAVEHLLLGGARVKTPLAKFSISIKGTFKHHFDPFDPERHQVTGKVSIGARLKKAIHTRVRVERKWRGSNRPDPLEFFDITSGERDGTLTPGGIGKVTGHRLKIDPDDETQGIFFVNADGDLTRVTLLAENSPAKLIFEIPPDLAPGGHRLVVQTPDGSHGLHWDKTETILTVWTV